MKKYLKKTFVFACFLGLFTTPLSLKAEEEKLEMQEFSQSTSINHTVHELESLFVLMQERLSLMHDVARYKWNAELKEKKLDEEDLVLSESGLENDAFITSFFEAQNQAANQIQNQDFSLFEKEKVEKFEYVKDFDKEIYPQLRTINQEILVTVNQLLVHTQNESLPDFLKDLSFSSFKNEGINRDIYDIAIEPLFTD